MTGLTSLLKAFGVRVSDEDLRKVEAIIPRIPQLTTETARKIETTLARVERGFSSIEARLDQMQARLDRIELEIRGG